MILHPIYNNSEYLSELASVKQFIQDIQADSQGYDMFLKKYRNLQFYIIYKVVNFEGKLFIRDLAFHDHNELTNQTKNLQFIIALNNKLYGDVLSTNIRPQYNLAHLLNHGNITTINRDIFT